MPNCLVGCIKKFSSCSEPPRIPGVGAPEAGAVLAPWVIAEFANGRRRITVGNKSAPDFGHHAIIASMEYGVSDGHELTLEIFDEQGGAFDEFVDIIIKCLNRPSENSKILLSFGWTIQDCLGNITKVGGDPKIEVIAMDLEVSFSEGKAKYRVTGKGSSQLIFSSREDQIYGQDDNKMPLKEAIRKLCEDREPKLSVRFLRSAINGGSTSEEFGFKGFGDQGPECVWDCDNENKLSTIQKWIEPFVTDNDRGIYVTVDNTVHNGIIVREDPKAKDGTICRGIKRLGTFIVNAGACSNVLEFSPKINWVQAFSHLSTGGAAGGAATGESEEKVPDEETECQGEQAGTQEGISISRYAWDCHGPKNAVKETEHAQNKHHKAGRHLSTGVIEGDLRILGLPIENLLNIANMAGTYLSIVVINPFYLGTSSGNCGEWLAQPGCNKVLSNKNWLLKGVNHKIEKGKFETTLNVMLEPPNIDLPADSPFGGDPDGYRLKIR